MENDVDKIQLIWKMDYGVPGCDADTSTPLSRAISQLFKEGKPFLNLCMCFFKDTSAALRWLGVFVQSAGNRLIYFPGFINDVSLTTLIKYKDFRASLCNGINHLILITYLSKKTIANGI